MKRYLLDTGIAGDFVERRPNVATSVKIARRSGARIGIGTPVLGELYYGIEYSATRERNLKRLQLAIAGLHRWPFDEAAAAEFGRLRAVLRRIGRPMQVVDIMIAAIALTLGDCVVMSCDSDLAAVPGLPVENWSA